MIDSSTSGTGLGGNIAVQAQRIALNDGGTISTRSTGQGNAGNVVLQASEVFQSRHGAVTTEAAQADGGNIQLTVGSRVELRDSQLTATVQGGEGQGGNITIDPQFVILQRSQITADAFGGPGGNIRLVAQGFVADAASRVSASSAQNVQGSITIEAVTTPSELVAPFRADIVPVAALLRHRCAVQQWEGTRSSLVVVGRGGVPAEPEGGLPSGLVGATVEPRGDAAAGAAAAVTLAERLPEAPALRRAHGWPRRSGTWRLAPSGCTP